jgi:hypothetical protein
VCAYRAQNQREETPNKKGRDGRNVVLVHKSGR